MGKFVSITPSVLGNPSHVFVPDEGPQLRPQGVCSHRSPILHSPRTFSCSIGSSNFGPNRWVRIDPRVNFLHISHTSSCPSRVSIHGELHHSQITLASTHWKLHPSQITLVSFRWRLHPSQNTTVFIPGNHHPSQITLISIPGKLRHSQVTWTSIPAPGGTTRGQGCGQESWKSGPARTS